MNGILGHTGVLLGFVAAVVGVVVIAVGLARGRVTTMRSGQIYAPIVLAAGLIAVVAMEHALITHDFSLSYVAANNSRSTPWLYSITGLWSALAGSILLWGLVLGGYATAMVWRFRQRSGDAPGGLGHARASTWWRRSSSDSCSGRPTRSRTWSAPSPPTVSAPNTLLQDNPLVLIHPPMLYLGLVGFTLPFAFAVASLITGRLDEDWQSETRRWTLFAWAFLSMGILLGAWWSYQVLGWGGFWGWDPVENAALLPWLVGTAYLHSVMVQQRRGLLRIWNLSLVVATFSLTILGTFLTRSGVIESVHVVLGVRPSARSCWVSSVWSCSRGWDSSPGGVIACARRAASTRPSAGRARSWPTTSCSSASPSSSCWERSSPSSTRHSTTAPSASAPRTSTGSSSRSAWPSSSSWRWPRPSRGGRPPSR